MITKIDVDREFDFVSVFSESGFFVFRNAVGVKKLSRNRFAVVGEKGNRLGTLRVYGEYEITETWKK